MPRTTSVVRKSQSKKVTKKAPRTARSSKRSAVKRRPKTKPVKRTTKRAAKKTKVVSITSTIAPVITPAVQVVPIPTPIMPAVSSDTYKTLPDTRSRSKVWLAVTATSAIIMVVWLYTLQKSWLTIPQTVTESVENSNVEALVSNIEEQLSSIQSSAEVLSNQTEPLLTSPSAETTTNTSTPSGDLNNLFSDLQ